MKLVSFRAADRPGVGVLAGEEVVDVTEAVPTRPPDVGALLASGDAALAAVREASKRPGARRFDLHTVCLGPPVARPPKFLAIGLNYADHVAEAGVARPEHQLWFNKQSTCVIGPGDSIEIPRASSMVDYEGELGVVVGRRCRHVRADEADEVVAGFLVVNDVSVRDWQRRTPTMTMGKSFDTHGPIGPWLVTPDELADVDHLRLRTWVNGELRQDATTDQMIFGWREQIAHLSTAFTLEPGDVISTGTPAGVGVYMTPPRFLEPGDVVRIEIEGIGVLENPVVQEPPQPVER